MRKDKNIRISRIFKKDHEMIEDFLNKTENQKI